MGGIFTRTIVVDLATKASKELEELDEAIEEWHTTKQSSISKQRAFTRSLLLYGTLVWIAIVIFFLYVIEFPNRKHVVAKAMQIGPIVAWPILLFLLKKSSDAYYRRRNLTIDAKLAKLEKTKAAKLEELVEKSNFNAIQSVVAKHSERKAPKPAQGAQTPASNTAAAAAAAGRSPAKGQVPPTPQHPHHQQRGGMAPPQTPANPRLNQQHLPPVTPMQQHQQNARNALQQQQQQLQQLQQQASLAPFGSIESAATSNSNRTALDKVVDFILNDGPNNKYALICPNCLGHNGLVREQDVGKLRYKCAMCGALNGPPLTPAQIQQMQQNTAAAAMATPAAARGPHTVPPSTGALATPAHAQTQSSVKKEVLSPMAPLELSDEAVKEEEATSASEAEEEEETTPAKKKNNKTEVEEEEDEEAEIVEAEEENDDETETPQTRRRRNNKKE